MFGLFKPRKWCLLDLVVGEDGKLVQTKVQSATFHALLASTVAFITWKDGTFNESMWTLYSVAAIGHAVIDKTGKQVADFKGRKLDAEAAPSTVEAEATFKETVTKP